MRQAILIGDVVGYSRLMEADEGDTHASMMTLQADVIQPQVSWFNGRFVKSTGDGFLAVFDEPNDAVQCAITMQTLLSEGNRFEAESRQINFRMGLNVADVFVENDDVFGDGVNVASRLQSFAEPCGVVMTAAVADRIESFGGFKRVDLGELPLRNIAARVEAVSLRLPSAVARPTGSMPAGTEQRPSIVVLPFRELSDTKRAYFAEGIVDEIIHALAGLRELFVIARGSTLGLRDAELNLRDVGLQFGVRYALSGTVQHSGDTLRVRTELYETETGSILFAERFDGSLDDLFDLQATIASRVVGILAPQVRQREIQRAMRKHPLNMTAYDYVLESLDPLFRMDFAEFSRAHGLLIHAINHDPSYGPAYSYAAYWHLLRVGQGWSKDPALDAEEASRFASAAIDRDPNDALALSILGHVHSYLLRDFDAAVELQERALEVGPSCALAWTLSSATQGYLGRGAEAVTRADHGLRLAPRGGHIVYHEHILSQAHYVDGTYDDAILWGRRAQRHNAGLTSNLRCLIASLVAVGQADEARRLAVALRGLDPGFSLEAWSRQTPLTGSMRDTFADRLKEAGL